MEWNPRFVNYARVHNRTVEQQLEHDREEFPGGVMCGFILWNQARIEEFKTINPDAFFLGHLYNHVAYDGFLATYRKQ